MIQTLRRLLGLAVLLLGLTIASAAFAITNVQVTPTGPRASETSIRLFDPTGKPVNPDPGNPKSFSSLPSGSYSAEVLVGGTPVGSRTPLRLDDGDNQLRVDSVTGSIEVLRRLGRTQQQQQDGWEFGAFGGWKRTPFSGVLSLTALNTSGTAFTRSGSSGLESDGGSAALEARYYLRRVQQQFGARLFLYGTYVEYFGTDEERRYLDFHPTAGNDSGIAVEERRSLIFGLGGRWNVAQQVGLELMLGVHGTWARIAALSDESCCGGPDNRISNTRTLWGPMVGVGVTYPVFNLASGRPVRGIARYTALRMDDIDVSGRSPRFPFDYAARVDGGWNHSVQFGLLF